MSPTISHVHGEAKARYHPAKDGSINGTVFHTCRGGVTTAKIKEMDLLELVQFKGELESDIGIFKQWAKKATFDAKLLLKAASSFKARSRDPHKYLTLP